MRRRNEKNVGKKTRSIPACEEDEFHEENGDAEVQEITHDTGREWKA